MGELGLVCKAICGSNGGGVRPHRLLAPTDHTSGSAMFSRPPNANGVVARTLIALRPRTFSEIKTRVLPISRHCHRRSRLPAQEAFPAVYRPALSRLKRHCRLPAALGARRHGLRFGKARPARRSLAFGLTRFATLGLVLEVLIVEEVLFSRCEYEICSAVYAFEDAVLKIWHGTILRKRAERFAIRPARLE